MNPLLVDAIGAILRWALGGLAVWFVDHHIWTQSEASSYVAAAAMSLIALGWALWAKYKSRLKLVTALSMPQGSTEHQVEQKISGGIGVPSATLGKKETP